jgi:PIN domain nuclease of toxin-antitoxin system
VTGLLADTHVLLWWRADDPRLTSPARDAMADPALELFFSAGSIWEMAIKQAAGKLDLPDDFVATMGERGFAELPISARHGLVAGTLPLHHRDPFDRMIVAQAQSERLTVITGDARIAAYEVPVLW